MDLILQMLNKQVGVFYGLKTHLILSDLNGNQRLIVRQNEYEEIDLLEKVRRRYITTSPLLQIELVIELIDLLMKINNQLGYIIFQIFEIQVLIVLDIFQSD